MTGPANLISRAVTSPHQKPAARPPSRVWSGIKRFFRWFGATWLLLALVAGVGQWLGLVDIGSKPSHPAAQSAVQSPAEQPPGSLEVTVKSWSEARGEHTVTKVRPMTWQRVTRSGMGEEWPLTVDAAWVGCSRELPMFSVVMVIDDVPWALNGSTKGWAKGDAYHLDIGGAWKAVRVSSTPEPWWAEDPGLVLGGKVGRKNITPLFNVADRIGCLLPPTVKR